MQNQAKLSNEDYQNTQDVMVAAAQVIIQLPLVEFLERISHAEAMGPIFDPTLYRKASKRLDNVKRLAEAYLHLQNEIRRQVREEEGVSTETENQLH